MTFDYLLPEFELDSEILEPKFVYRKGKYKEMNLYLSSINWPHLFMGKTINEVYEIFLIIVLDACEMYIPRVNYGLKKNKCDWINKDIKALIRKKWNLWYYNRSIGWKCCEKNKQYRDLCNKVKQVVKFAKIEFEKNIALKAKKNPKLLFKYAKKKQKVKGFIRALKNSNGDLINDNGEIVNILNEQFQSVFVKESQDFLPDFPERTSIKC